MEKEFIPYEQALALKELGFDEPCLACVGENNEVIIRVGDYRSFSNKKPEDSIERDFYNNIIKDFNSYVNDTASAPTFSQAFRWFREKYDLTWEHQFDDSNISLYVGEITYPDNNLDFFKIIEVEYNGYNKAYEEAELECLKKLIEIVKEKL
jgi:hypothetical protein